jgi:hypothetical protein
MMRRAWLGKPALAAALAVLLAAELLLPGPAAPPAREAPGIPAGTTAQIGDDAISQWSAAILARPLFNQNRRPVQVASTASGNVLPRLSAVIVIGNSRRAVFATPGQKPQIIGQGESIGPYTLDAIAPDKVELRGPDGPMTLRPQFLAAAPATVANNN